MKERRHHNNTGLRQIKRGRTRQQVQAMAQRLGVPYGDPKCPDPAGMGEHACANRHQCWEPCGELGKSAEHAHQSPLEHTASPDCWCGPEVDYVDPDTGSAVYVHRDVQ